MEPLITLLVVSGVTLAANAMWFHRDRGLELALRAGLCALFLLTGTVHFVGMHAELIDMVPSRLPFAGLLVTVSGILELAGALGMLASRLVPWAGLGLSTLLVAVFPANAVWALSEPNLPWWDELLPRTVIQMVYLAATLTLVRLTSPRRTRPEGPVDGPCAEPDRSEGTGRPPPPRRS